AESQLSVRARWRYWCDRERLVQRHKRLVQGAEHVSHRGMDLVGAPRRPGVKHNPLYVAGWTSEPTRICDEEVEDCLLDGEHIAAVVGAPCGDNQHVNTGL